MNERQKVILEMLAAGKKDKQIAYELNISQPTLRCAIKRAVETLGAKSRIEAVLIYFERKSPDDDFPT